MIRMIVERTIAVLLLMVVSGPVYAQDWSMVNGNMERTSLAVGLAPQPPLELVKWMEDVYADQFSVHKGVLYAARGGEPNTLTAISLESGEELWSFSIPGSRGACDNVPAVIGDLVLIGGQQGSALHAVSRVTGKEVWAVPTRSLYARCVVSDGSAAFVCSDSLLCIELPAGAIRWKYPINAAITPTVDESSVYLNANNRLWAIDKTSGALRWNTWAYDRSYSQVIVDGDVLYYTEGDTVRAANKSDGEVLWQYGVSHVTRLSQLATGALALGGGSLCVSAWEDTTGIAQLHVLDKANGTLRWRKQFSGKGVFTPTVVGNTVYAVEFHNRTLWAFNLATGAEVLRRDDASYEGQPVVADGKLFVADVSYLAVFEERATSVRTPGITPELHDLRIAPQPARQDITVSFTLAHDTHVGMALFDVNGSLVAAHPPRRCVPGPVRLRWHLQRNRAGRIAPGTYFLRISAGKELVTRKILFLGH